ncbi:MAG: DNA cytosine methyltransferase [Snowella sp.]|nr:DNA cytosine methyltransferase [Snowella sp.]
MNHNRPIGIDLFAGAGGLSLGFEQAGFDVVAAVEIDPIHAAVHHFNFPNCIVIPQSVTQLTGKSIRKAASIGDRAIDIVFGGAPCQGFSLIGQRAFDDPRNGLVKEFVRLVKELDASYFLFENVKGLTVGRHRQFLEEIITEFAAIGYQVKLPWQVLNASAYGIPQDRERLILLGAKKGLKLPDYPQAFTRAAGKTIAKNLPIGPTCQDALGDLPEAEEYDDLIEQDTVFTDKWGKPSSYAHKMRCLDKSAWEFGYPRYWEPTLLTASLRTLHSEISRRRFADTPPGTIEPISRFFRLPSQGISNTLRAGTDASRGAFTSPRPIHYEKARCITVREMARLHGFPDWFRFHQTKWHGARQIGNSVPPPMARAIAAEIIKVLEIIPSQPQKKLYLGDTQLLQMIMSQAAQYWEIPNPIAQRDRKSNVKRRKQSDIENMMLSMKKEKNNG